MQVSLSAFSASNNYITISYSEKSLRTIYQNRGNIMANAKFENRTVVTKVKVKVVSLELTIEEAETLRDILARVGGHPETTRRGLTDETLNSLRALLGTWSVKDMTPDSGIVFKPRS
jgi:phage gp16-like protein